MPYLLLRHMVGMALIVALALALSADRRAIRLRVVGPALGLQVALAGLVLGVPGGHAALEAVARGVLLDEVWGYNAAATTHTLETHIYRLRQKIEADPANPVHLVTVRGLGYKLEG